MSTFIVYGITRESCRQKSVKNVSPKYKNGRDKPMSEYSNDLKNYQDRLWDSAKQGPVSGFFDDPKFAREWISLCGDKGKGLTIMCKRVVCDAEGKPLTGGNGRQMTEIVPWAPD